MRMRKILSVFLLITMIAGLFAGCTVKDTSTDATKTLADLKNATIGVITGSAHNGLVDKNFPEAKKINFNLMADMILAVQQGKIDCYIEDAPFMAPLLWEGVAVKSVDEAVAQVSNGFVFPQSEESTELRQQINAFLAAVKADGTIDRLVQKWMGNTEPTEHPDYSQLTGENGTIHLAISVDNKPMLYQNAGGYTGFEMELLTLFGQQSGYAFDIEVVPFESIIAGISSGKYDMGASTLNITPEREESVDFSDPYASFDVVMVVKDTDAASVADGGQANQALTDFKNASIGIMTGSSHDGTAKELFPDAERVYFNTVADMVLATEQGKIDGYIEDAPFLFSVLWEGANVKRVDESIKQVSNGFAFPQSEESHTLREQVNAFIAASKADGTLDALMEKWFGATEPTEHPDYTSLSGENGTIRLAVVVENKPAVYLKDDRCTGFEMEFLTRFAQQYGYKFEIEAVPFGSVIAGIAAGKYDMASASLNITPEREESVDFSDPYAFFDVVMVVKNTDGQQTGRTLADFENASIGVLTGSVYDDFAKERFPSARRDYYGMFSDMIVAVEQEKIDGYLSENTYVTAAIWEGAKIQAIDEAIDCTHAGFIFQKSEESALLREQMNAFIRAAKENGTLDALNDKWFGKTEPTEGLDYDSLTGENGTLKIAVAPDLKPISYIKDGELTGYETEIILLFAKEYGYKLDMSYMTFDAILPGVTTGKYDIGTGAVTITEERAQSLDFSESHLTVDVVMVVKSDASQSQPQMTMADLQNGKLAILTGTIWNGVAQNKFPNADRKYFSSMTDMTLSLEQGKVDAILGDKTFYVNARWEDVPVSILDDTIGSISCGFMLAKDTYDPVLYEQLNAFITQSEQDGTLDALYKKWLSDEEPSDHPDYRSLSGENGTLKIAVDSTAKPMTYQKGDTFTGYDVELLTEFARAYGYSLDFMGMSFSALIPAVASEKCDIGACGIAITPERAESVTFTTSYETIEGVAIVSQAAKSTPRNEFWKKMSESFHKTFIRENRWKLIVEGIGVTMLISICAAAAGSLLGFGLYMLSRSDVKLLQMLAKGVAKVYSRIIAGTPVVVILMILFYVIFGKIRDMNGIVVAIIGFTLTFGAFVYDHMTVSVSSVDRGQIEAAYALGYTKNKTFFRIVFPQAMSIFLPSYCGQAVELIKATAVVGYVAVNDLTKMGDIIRSNTYEAFFPLIATAVIYFLLTWVLAALLGLVKRRFEPKRRKKEDILKGVKTV